MGKEKRLPDLFAQCKDFLYPPKAKEKNIEPDEDTRQMLNLVEIFRDCAGKMQSGITLPNGLDKGNTDYLKQKFIQMRENHEVLGPLSVEVEKARSTLEEILSDPQRAKKLNDLMEYSSFDRFDEEIEGKMKKMSPTELMEHGPDVQKYLVARETILQAFAEDEGAERKRVSEEFRKMEWDGFTHILFPEHYKELMSRMIPDLQKRLQDERDDIEADEDFKTYEELLKQNKELMQLDENEKTKLFQAKLAAEKDTYGRDLVAGGHGNRCEKILKSIGLTDISEIMRLSTPENWAEVCKRFDKELAAEKQKAEDLSKKAESANAILDKLDIELENTKTAQNHYSKRENQLGASLKEIVREINENKNLRNNLHEVSEAKKAFMGQMTEAYRQEERFHKEIDQKHGMNFADKRISAQLEKLHKALTDPTRKSNSPEYLALKDQLETTQKLFSGKSENDDKLSYEKRKEKELKALEDLGKAANTYLTEKEKQPHIWPFASVTGFQRRAAANDILSFSKSASDMVQNTPTNERRLEQDIQKYKTPDNHWKEKAPEEFAEDRILICCRNVRTTINEANLSKDRELTRSRDEKDIQHEASEKKNGGASLGAV